MNKLQKWILGLQIITVILAIAFISVVSYFIIDDYKLNEKYKISYIKPTVEDIIWDKDLLESKETIDEEVIIDKVDDLFTVNYSWSKSNLSGSTKGISNISKKTYYNRWRFKKVSISICNGSWISSYSILY